MVMAFTTAESCSLSVALPWYADSHRGRSLSRPLAIHCADTADMYEYAPIGSRSLTAMPIGSLMAGSEATSISVGFVKATWLTHSSPMQFPVSTFSTASSRVLNASRFAPYASPAGFWAELVTVHTVSPAMTSRLASSGYAAAFSSVTYNAGPAE